MEVSLQPHSGEACLLRLSASEGSQTVAVQEDQAMEAAVAVAPVGAVAAQQSSANSCSSTQGRFAEDSQPPLVQAAGSTPVAPAGAGEHPCTGDPLSKDSLPCELSVPETPHKEPEEAGSLSEEGSSLHLIMSQDLALCQGPQEVPPGASSAAGDSPPSLPKAPEAQTAPGSLRGGPLEDSVQGSVQSGCQRASLELPISQPQPDAEDSQSLGKASPARQVVLPARLPVGKRLEGQCTGEKNLLPLEGGGDVPTIALGEAPGSRAAAGPGRGEPVGPSESQPAAGREGAVLGRPPLPVEGDGAVASGQTPRPGCLEGTEKSAGTRREMPLPPRAPPSLPEGTCAAYVLAVGWARCGILGASLGTVPSLALLQG